MFCMCIRVYVGEMLVSKIIFQHKIYSYIFSKTCAKIKNEWITFYFEITS